MGGISVLPFGQCLFLFLLKSVLPPSVANLKKQFSSFPYSIVLDDFLSTCFLMYGGEVVGGKISRII